MLGSKNPVMWCKPSVPISQQTVFTTSQEATLLSQHRACGRGSSRMLWVRMAREVLSPISPVSHPTRRTGSTSRLEETTWPVIQETQPRDKCEELWSDWARDLTAGHHLGPRKDSVSHIPLSLGVGGPVPLQIEPGLP